MVLKYELVSHSFLDLEIGDWEFELKTKSTTKIVAMCLPGSVLLHHWTYPFFILKIFLLKTLWENESC